ncbi:transposase [Corallococcus macrosporus]|uniref:transposase n=1 Tax=Corallococcus macrosporus TaxID=35 RepID=UPI0039BEE1C9
MSGPRAGGCHAPASVALRSEAHIPAEVAFQTKPQLALRMIERAVEDGAAPGVLLADSTYGDSNNFRARLRALGLHDAVERVCPPNWRSVP